MGAPTNSMQKHSVEAIIRALNDAEVRYLIVGGLAVIAHGYMRFTTDVDLLLDLEQDNVQRAIAVLQSLDYRPRLPIAITDFADTHKREQWVNEKNLIVFSLASTQHPLTEIDIFAQNPFSFTQAYETAAWKEVVVGLTAPIISLEDLLRLKQQAGRPQDINDIARLKELHHAGDNE